MERGGNPLCRLCGYLLVQTYSDCKSCLQILTAEEYEDILTREQPDTLFDDKRKRRYLTTLDPRPTERGSYQWALVATGFWAWATDP